jgi:phage tail-like protein
MARALDSDPLQNFNYYLLDIPTLSLPPVAFPFKIGQGAAEGNLLSFKSISIPSVTMSTKTIQEGNWPYTHEIPLGYIKSGDCTIEAAVTTLSMDFYLWFMQAVWGKGAPRRHFTVIQTGRDKLIPRRIYNLLSCFPKSWTPSSNMDASSSDISIESLTMGVHSVEVLPGTPVT